MIDSYLSWGKGEYVPLSMKIRYSAYSTSMIFYTETLNLKPGIVVIFSKKFEGNPLTIDWATVLSVCMYR